MDLIAELSIATGHDFQNAEIGLQALTHSSYAKTNHIPNFDNERLEYLGDAVLELSVSKYLYASYTQMHEGELTRARSWLVREDSLYRAALHIGLDKLIRLDSAEEKIGGRTKPSILSDAFEAVIAAIYIDGGFEAADNFINRSLLRTLTKDEILPQKDPKTLLQEYIQSKMRSSKIAYELLETSGPDHKKQFRMGVAVDDAMLGEGIGFSKREAEEKAAEAALLKLTDVQETK